ncbi:hypothetical protein [Scytonema sp. NUACC21]
MIFPIDICAVERSPPALGFAELPPVGRSPDEQGVTFYIKVTTVTPV